jgi:hypothetical protein
MSAQYVYAIARPAQREPEFGASGLGGKVELVGGGSVAALVSAVDDVPILATRKNLAAHADVLEEAFAQMTVLPLRFGTVLPDRKAVETELLQPRADVFDRLLTELEGLVELTLKGYYDEQVVLGEIVASSAPIRRLRKRVKNGEGGHLDAVRLGELVAGELETRRARDTAQIVERLSPLARDTKLASVPVDRGVVNAAFLVDRNRIEEFDREADSVARDYDRRISFKYVGPLPPYSFVSVEQWAS